MPLVHFSLDVSPDPSVLPRVVAVARRRGAIVGLSYAGADFHRPGHIDLLVETRHERLLRDRLLGLVDVSDVQTGISCRRSASRAAAAPRSHHRRPEGRHPR